MISKSYSLTSEPSGDDYVRLIEYATHAAATILLVVRDQSFLDSAARSFLDRVSSEMLRVSELAHWPGTFLHQGVATVYHLRATDVASRALIDAADRLYAWEHPSLPEDPAFIRSDGSVALGTIAHERDAFLELTEREFEELTHGLPFLETGLAADSNQ